MCEYSERKGEIVVYHCYAGLSEIVFPIKIEKKLVGYGMLGQFRNEQGLPETIIQDWTKAGLAPENLLQFTKRSHIMKNRPWIACHGFFPC